MTKSNAPYKKSSGIHDTMEIHDWDRLTALYKIQEFERAEIFLAKGEKNRNLYFVLEGNAQALIDEQSHIISRIQTGEFIGEISFLDGLPTTVPMLAESGSKIACIDGEALLDLCQSDSCFAEHLYKYLALLLARRLRRTTSIINEIKTKPAHHTSSLSNQTIKMNDFEFRPLNGEDEIQDAMQLLHAIYILEQGWTLQEFNPSMVRVESRSGRKILIDKFSDSAHWFGAFHKGTLVGCIRVLPYPALELKEYRPLPLFIAHSGVSEMNRLALAPAYRAHKFVMIFLIRLALDHAFSLGSTVYVTAMRPEPAKLFERLGFTRANLPSFKYNVKETVEVDLLYGQSSDRNDYPLYRLSDKLMVNKRP